MMSNTGGQVSHAALGKICLVTYENFGPMRNSQWPQCLRRGFSYPAHTIISVYLPIGTLLLGGIWGWRPGPSPKSGEYLGNQASRMSTEYGVWSIELVKAPHGQRFPTPSDAT
ncbi:hypothetical protein BDV32DRAFT_121972 [Aspergillus pseudonomiae]|nr:hypothetical protein BDV32DRAFT_121972 [Aspergillus pseudonomiae]